MSLFPVSLGGASALSDNPTQSKYHPSEVTFAPCYHNVCHLIHYSTNSLSCLLDARQPLIPKGHVCKRLLVILSLQTSLGSYIASGIRRKEANNLDLFLMILNLYMMKEIRKKCEPEICRRVASDVIFTCKSQYIPSLPIINTLNYSSYIKEE